MGWATWQTVLRENNGTVRGRGGAAVGGSPAGTDWRARQCPFTQQPLSMERIKRLTKSNIDVWRDRMVK